MAFQRILFRFSKEGEAKFLSHRDLMRLFERALRRAGLPVRMSQGFNPHPRLSILSALALGVEAANEAVEIGFEPPVAPAEAMGRLGEQLPEGVRLRSAQALPEGARMRVESVVYEAELPAGRSLEPEAVSRFLAQEAAVVERATPAGRRAVDVRPAVEGMAIEGGRLRFQLRVSQGGTPKATDVLAAVLGCAPEDVAGIPLRRAAVNVAVASPPQQAEPGR